MKKELFLISISTIALLCMSGCHGKGSDTIKVSETDVTVSASAQTVNLYTEGDFDFDCIYYSTEKDGVEIYDVTISKACIDGEYDYTAPWFSIHTANNRHKIIIELQENTSGIPRYFRVQIYSGDYYQWISVSQSS